MGGWLGSKRLVGVLPPRDGLNRCAHVDVSFDTAPLNGLGDDVIGLEAYRIARLNSRPCRASHRAQDGRILADCPSCQAQVWAVST